MLAERQKKKDGGGDDDLSDEDMSGSESSSSKLGGNKSASHKKIKSGGESLGKSVSKGGKSFVGSDEDQSEQFNDDNAESDEEYDNGMADLPSQPAMKRELIQAIEDERREYQELKYKNEECQKKIFLMDNTRDYEKSTDAMLHEHKYLNTLANVHQVRYNLKETQDRYNRMAGELQNKLNEKQTKCTEIEQQFKELKRSVAMNAVHSRTGKKLNAKVIKEWEDADEAKD